MRLSVITLEYDRLYLGGEEHMQNDLLTVAEFAKRLNITVQSVYKQINGKLKPFLVVVDGKKMLEVQALEVIREEKNAKPESLNRLINTLERENERLNHQIEVKDRQIEILMQQLSLYQAQQLALPEKTERKPWQFWKKS